MIHGIGGGGGGGPDEDRSDGRPYDKHRRPFCRDKQHQPRRHTPATPGMGPSPRNLPRNPRRAAGHSPSSGPWNPPSLPPLRSSLSSPLPYPQPKTRSLLLLMSEGKPWFQMFPVGQPAISNVLLPSKTSTI